MSNLFQLILILCLGGRNSLRSLALASGLTLSARKGLMEDFPKSLISNLYLLPIVCRIEKKKSSSVQERPF